MKKLIVVPVLSLVLSLMATPVFSAGGHDGHGSGGKGRGASACKTTIISRTKPEHLATVAPQSEFSFWVKGIKDPDAVSVTAKKIPVALEVEDKEHFFLFTGTLPESLKGTAARIQVNVDYKKCPAAKGWLVKITD
ncbi:MAG: hypothetical protein RQ733_04145 [Methyloprofundus sp.]|nr:hypothetical protein [Methyloprofundus sp.]MDT8425144.1 hypothetical protein [Methyloprofundus sp.]